MIKYVICIAALIGAFWGGYQHANTSWELKYSQYRLQAEQNLADALQAKIDADKRANDIEKEHLSKEQEITDSYEKVIADMRANFKPSGVQKCDTGNSAVQARINSGELICYTRSELYDRIAKTLAIGSQCDKLAEKYNSLLKIVAAEPQE